MSGAADAVDDAWASVGEIAIIGMAARFPGSAGVDDFWHALRRGEEAARPISAAELERYGVGCGIVEDPGYLWTRALLEDIDLFDADFFGYSPREAELMDPQQRVFLECAWTALEDAGHDPARIDGAFGVYAGSGWNSYMVLNLAGHPDVFQSDVGHFALLGNDKDNLATRVSYKLDLRGPSMTVQTGCSTSLVAIATACQSLLAHQCDVALAGGVSIVMPQAGRVTAGGIFSPDGRCRAFDGGANGTVLGSGAGIVVLKRLDDALAESDHIHAVIKGTAVNNDGSAKLGYTAPSVDGQAEVIAEALSVAGVSAETIGYVEAHGTGTPLGDPIEVAALTKAFRATGATNGACALGSVKTNIGHADAAAGVAGVIKTALALQHAEIPASLNFETPNPEIDFEGSPFSVNTELRRWDADEFRRAGVSSFGIGGTNVHAVLEEAPSRPASGGDGSAQLLVLSARTPEALDVAGKRLAVHLRSSACPNLADVAHTLQIGRRAFAHRRYAVGSSAEALADALERVEPPADRAARSTPPARGVAWMFPGDGVQHVHMARGLYEAEPEFRREVDRACDLLASREGLELRPVLYPEDGDPTGEARLRRIDHAHPALFLIEYALGRLLASWGLPVDAVVGHSLGEYAAATLAGVFSLDDALSLVVHRARLMQALGPGAMLAVHLPAERISEELGDGMSVAAINEPGSCVVSGAPDAISALERTLTGRDVACRRLAVSQAFHSPIVEPILDDFAAGFERVSLQPPSLPLVSSSTGTWLTEAEAADPHYWVGHARRPVRFSDALETLLGDGDLVVVEVGPGTTLERIASRHPRRRPGQLARSLLPHSDDAHADVASALDCLGYAWQHGADVDWRAYARGRDRRRVRLPTYPFERKRYWVAPADAAPRSEAPARWAAVVGAARPAADRPVAALERLPLDRHADRIADLCSSHILRALGELGIFAPNPAARSLEDVFEARAIAPRYRQLVDGMLAALAERGEVQREGGVPREVAPVSAADVASREARARECDVDRDLLNLIHECGEGLPGLLRGERQPVELFEAVIEGDGGRPATERILDDCTNEVLRRAAGAAREGAPRARPFRILEVGGGTGIATAALLDAVDADYTFTDASNHFLVRARERFGRNPNVRFRRLDIERPAAEQGLARESYDVIVAVNVLHVVRDVGSVLDHLVSLLAPGGFLLAREITEGRLDFALTYGLLMQPVDDRDRSPADPFLSGDEWTEAMRAHGFARAVALPEAGLHGQQVLIAQAPNELGRALPAADRPPDVRDMARWFYVPGWKRAPARRPRAGTRRGLVLLDGRGVGTTLTDALRRRGHDVVAVRPEEVEDYAALLDELRPDMLVHLASLDAGAEGASDGVATPAFRSLVRLAQAIGHSMLAHPLELTVVTERQMAVTGEEAIDPASALMLGPCRVIPLEYPHVSWRAVDIELSASSIDRRAIEELAEELLTHASGTVIAHRGGERWLQAIEPLRAEATAAAPRLRSGGACLITGGLGHIGMTLAEHLVATRDARLILISRSGEPRDEDRLRRLLATGADVLVVAADVADRAAVGEAIRLGEERFGPLRGVIHAAGVLGDGFIQQKTEDAVDEVLRPKVLGTLVLDDLLRDRELDFFVLFSSLSALRPGPGQAAYAAANCFLDAFAQRNRTRVPTPVTCISWDVWRGTGLAYAASPPTAVAAIAHDDFDERGIRAEEGVEAFDRALASGEPHVLVATTDYLLGDDNLAERYAARLDSPDPRLHDAGPRRSGSGGAPRTETERLLAGIWSVLLGIEEIGVADDFFELGGDSLLGTLLITRLRERFGVTLAPKAVYLHPTIASLAPAVEDALVHQISDDQFDRALDDVTKAERPTASGRHE